MITNSELATGIVTTYEDFADMVDGTGRADPRPSASTETVNIYRDE